MNYLRMLAKGEALFRFLTLIFLCVLVFVQILFLSKTTRLYLSYTDRLEGESVSINLPLYQVKTLVIDDSSRSVASAPLKSLRESKTMIIRIINPRSSQQIFVTVNGQTAGDFGTGKVKLTVFNGDYIEIDASAFADTAHFIIDIPSAGLLFPEDGMSMEATRTSIPIGKVKFK